jgi:hypothetical protein
VDGTNGYGGSIYVVGDLSKSSKVSLYNCTISGGYSSVSALDGGFIWMDGVCLFIVVILCLI